MTNLQAADRFDQAHGAIIEKMFWIAGSFESRDFKELIEEDFEDSDWEKVFPDIYKSKFFAGYVEDGEQMQLLIDYRKLGFLAEIGIPECDNFTYKKGKPVSWSVHGGITIRAFAYAETTAGLLKEIERIAKTEFEFMVKEDKKK